MSKAVLKGVFNKTHLAHILVLETDLIHLIEVNLFLGVFEFIHLLSLNVQLSQLALFNDIAVSLSNIGFVVFLSIISRNVLLLDLLPFATFLLLSILLLSFQLRIQAFFDILIISIKLLVF